MKRLALILLALAALTLAAQVVLETRTTEVRRTRFKTSVTFDYNPTNGTLNQVEVRSADVTTVDGEFSSRRPGPVLRLSPEELVAAVPDYPSAQAGFNAWVNGLLTNAPAGE